LYQQAAGAHSWFTVATGTAGGAAALAQGMVLNANGHLGLGLTPSVSSITTLELNSAGNTVSSGSANQILVTAGAYYNAGWKYGAATSAVQIGLEGGGITFSVAPAGATGGAVTFTPVMFVDGSHNVGIGAAPNASYSLDINRVGQSAIRLLANTTADVPVGIEFARNTTTYGRRWALGIGEVAGVDYLSITDRTAAAIRFAFGSAGQLGVGGANYGTAGQVFTSGGPSAAPTWSSYAGVAYNTQSFVQFSGTGSISA